MRKLSLDEWIILLVKSMYENTKKESACQLALFSLSSSLKHSHQSSSRGHQELLYADDLVAVTEEELRRKVENWKEKLEIKGLRVNVLKTKK